MNSKLVGVFLIIMGIMLIVWGYDMYDSVDSQVSRALGGGIPFQTWVGVICGSINVFVGILKVKD